MYTQKPKHLSIILTILSFLVILYIPAVHAADLTLTWNKPNDDRVVGYNIYCGISGTEFTQTPVQTVNSADQTSCLISGLTEGETYDFAATSYDADGNESVFSETINYLVLVSETDNDSDGYTANEGDCNDSDASIHPGAAEVCGDGIDQDCSGSDLTCPEDIDNDGDGFTQNEGDCDDSDATVFPGAIEICGDGIDQDCSGIDLDCSPDPADTDDDGDGFTENDGDCNDRDVTVFPGAIEICGDGIDQDCNGSDLICTSIDGLTLSWNRPDDSRVTGYNIYCGKAGTDFKSVPYVTIYSADTTSYTFTDLEEGFEYSFAATSFDVDGNESAFSETITYFVGSSSDARTLVFGDTLDADHPGTVVDTFLNLNEDVNYAGDQLNTYTWPENMPANSILLQFDLSQIPAGAQIQSATLSLYQTAAGGDATYDVAAHKIINHNPDLYQANGYTFDGVNDWTANNVCYNSVPLAQADIATAEDVNSLDQTLGYKNWDVTGMVQEWANDDASNYGLMLNSGTVASSDSYRFFASSEALDASQRPSLEVTYTSNESSDIDGDGYTVTEGDCNDSDASIHPNAAETCGDGIDQDCDGIDLTCPEDIDNDSDGYTENQGDCNDSDASIHPGAAEVCGDGIDQDCNGSDLTCPEDVDDDADGYTENEGDCNDSDASIHPGAAEICGDGIDQDCDGIDLTCPEDIDNDSDGYTENQGDCNDSDASIHPGAAEVCGDGIDQDCNGSDLTCPEDVDDDADGYTENEGDCNDSDASIHPGAAEICGDGIDQDCDGIDLTCPEDIDNDSDGYTENQGDCNDSDASVHPGASEICGDGIDQDCDGSDLTCPEDIDNDADGYSENEGDCNDNDASIHPGAAEVCGDGIDQDCNGSDLTCPEDIDNDGDGYTENEGDCKDSDASIHPGAAEVCGDGIDQDCSGSDLTCPEDIDNDGDGFTQNEGDCDDSDATVFPGAIEICGDGIDQDCSGIDLDCSPDPADTDDDGDGFTENDGDCNDRDVTVFPGAIEICGDGIDQDCNGSDLICTSIDGLTLSWNRPDDSRVTGYNIYCGKAGTDFKSVPYVTIYSADTTSYTFTDLEEGFEYSFAATSFDVDGNESAFSETITYFVGSSSDARTLVFGDTLDADHPGTVVDTFLNLNEDVNYAGDQLNTYTWPENMPANSILLQFDLSQIPAGAQIQSATLSLYQTAAGGDATYDVAAHKIINHNPDLYQANGYTFDGVNDWTANNVCYNSVPLAQADIATAEDVNSLDQTLGYKNWDVTGMVQEWANDDASNYGLMLNSGTVASSDSYRFFASSEALDASQRPSLEVTYTSNESSDIDGDGYTVTEGDCNDSDTSIHPNAAETCGDGIDQDCNGSDLICPEDIDNDADGYTENEGDCNDNDASIHPGAAEICGDGIDQDCNGSDLTCPEDIDDDSDGYTENQGDCNDSDASIHPGAAEVCGDGIDQDCNGSDLICPEDIDNDADGYTENEGDCDDNNALIHPGATEICGDGVDQNCNGSDLTCPEDIDDDSDGYTENQGDCNDSDASIYPGATEICGDGIDQDCNGSDLECLPDPNDVDDDGDGYTENEGDCDDNDITIFPGAIEICGDGIDQDCDGSDLECIDEGIPGFVMETGEAEVNHNWQFVPFTKTYVNPVVVAKPMSLNGDQPGVIRINNVTSEGFEIRVQEWGYLDGWHADETVGYMVMEAGHHVLPTGILVEAGTIDSNSASKTVNFDAAFNQIPVLVSAVTTENETDAVVGRLDNITLNGFDIKLQEEESHKSGHYADETVSYIAWEPSSGEVDGMSYIVDSTFDEVTHKFSNIAFYPVFDSAPVFVADMQTTDGGDTANVRWRNKTGEGVEVQIDEEQSQNPETNHITEVVGYMAFGLVQ